MSRLDLRLVRLLHANGWKYTSERCESRDYMGAPDSEWIEHTWTRDDQQIRTWTGEFHDGIDWTPNDGDEWLTTSRRMIEGLGYDWAVRVLAAIGAVAPDPAHCDAARLDFIGRDDPETGCALPAGVEGHDPHQWTDGVVTR